MLKRILIALVAIPVVLLTVVAMQPRVYRIERSIQISAPMEVIWAEINDFERWRKWSPWLKTAPTHRRTIEGDPGMPGHASRWQGDDIGKGTMTIVDVTRPDRIGLKVDFREPVVAEARSAIELKRDGEIVELTWSLNGNSDFEAKFYNLFMGTNDEIGAGYEAGLIELRTIAEDSAWQHSEAIAAAEELESDEEMHDDPLGAMDNLGGETPTAEDQIEGETQQGADPTDAAPMQGAEDLLADPSAAQVPSSADELPAAAPNRP